MDEATLRAEYQLGLEVEAFLGVDTGKYLIACCEQDRLVALEDLANVNPEDAKTIREIQNRIKVAEAIPAYLNEIVVRSRQAEEQLRLS